MSKFKAFNSKQSTESTPGIGLGGQQVGKGDEGILLSKSDRLAILEEPGEGAVGEKKKKNAATPQADDLQD